jgi:hypothetical protein
MERYITTHDEVVGGGWVVVVVGVVVVYMIFIEQPNHGFSMAFDQDEVFTGIGPRGEGRAPPTIT